MEKLRPSSPTPFMKPGQHAAMAGAAAEARTSKKRPV
jgi:hypothetical protein